MNPEVYISVVALGVSTVSLALSFHSARRQRAVRLAERKGQILCEIAEADLLWSRLYYEAMTRLRVLQAAGMDTLPTDLSELIDNLKRTSSDLAAAGSDIRASDLTSEPKAEKRLAAAREMNVLIRQKHDHAMEVLGKYDR